MCLTGLAYAWLIFLKFYMIFLDDVYLYLICFILFASDWKLTQFLTCLRTFTKVAFTFFQQYFLLRQLLVILLVLSIFYLKGQDAFLAFLCFFESPFGSIDGDMFEVILYLAWAVSLQIFYRYFAGWLVCLLFFGWLLFEGRRKANIVLAHRWSYILCLRIYRVTSCQFAYLASAANPHKLRRWFRPQLFPLDIIINLIIFRRWAIATSQKLLPLHPALPRGGTPRENRAFHPRMEYLFSTGLCPSHPSDSFPLAVDDGIVAVVITDLWWQGQHEPIATLLFFI